MNKVVYLVRKKVGEKVLNWVYRKAVESEANWADQWAVLTDLMLVDTRVGY